MSANAQLPQYQSHKKVRALKIAAVKVNQFGKGGMLFPRDEGFMPFAVNDQFLAKRPEVGGYYVVYDDGYVSYSPAKAFEEGYTRI